MNGQRKPYNTLVLSGGAVKGFALLGGLQYMMDHNMLTGVHKIIGTSIGAIIGYLLCIGYSPMEMMVFLCQSNWLNKLTNFDIYNVLQGAGAVSFSVVHEMLEKLTVSKIGKFLTLKQLEQDYHKTLICYTFNYSKDKEECLSPRTHPDLPCLTALRMSANLPIVFEPFHYDGHIYFDGGLQTNFPIHGVDLTTDRVVGLLLCKGVHSNNNENASDLLHHAPSSFELLWKVLSVPMNVLQKTMTQPYFRTCDIIEMHVDGCFALQFDISKSEKFDMFSLGYNITKKYYEQDTIGMPGVEATARPLSPGRQPLCRGGGGEETGS